MLFYLILNKLFVFMCILTFKWFFAIINIHKENYMKLNLLREIIGLLGIKVERLDGEDDFLFQYV